uniref:Uncharacterized protein n=1 Tax=Rhizophora mucronata TaxID=61149 RepID=A0A2P2PLW8_RHIMU
MKQGWFPVLSVFMFFCFYISCLFAQDVFVGSDLTHLGFFLFF